MQQSYSEINENLFTFRLIKGEQSDTQSLDIHLIRFLRHMEIKVLIVEDNPITAQDLEEILNDNGIAVVGIARTANQAINKARDLYPDIIIMDINLDGEKDGISAIKEIYKTDYYPVIYLTANTDREHVEKAYATSPAAFLSKPFAHKDLVHAIELAFVNHYKKIFTSADLPGMNKCIFLKNGEKYEKIAIDEIQLVKADGSYSTVVTKNQSYSISLNLQGLSEKVQNPLFFRLHRSYIVNLNWISGFDNQHVFVGETPVPYSKNYRDDLMKFLNRL